MHITMDKEIIVIGDIELGAGTLTDDFISDEAISTLFIELSKKTHPVDLILNGDTFDFLKCPSELHPTKYARHITKKISLDKLNFMYKAHKPFFHALRKFVSKENKVVYFILGNHDHDLVYPEVQDEIRKLLHNFDNVKFPGLVYKKHKVYVEHGHQYDFVFRINLEKLFLKYNEETILNMPFVSFGFLGPMMRLKERYPFVERINPKPALLTHHQIVMKKINRKTLGYFIKSLIYYPFRFYSDPTYSAPTHMLREFYRRVKTKHLDIDNIMEIFKKKKKQAKYKIYVLGHEHQKRISKGRKKVIIHPGTWRDEYQFNPKTRELLPLTKRYVQIEVTNGNPEYKLVDVIVPRTIFDFDEVVKDELKFIQKAADEEHFKLYLS